MWCVRMPRCHVLALDHTRSLQTLPPRSTWTWPGVLGAGWKKGTSCFAAQYGRLECLYRYDYLDPWPEVWEIYKETLILHHLWHTKSQLFSLAFNMPPSAEYRPRKKTVTSYVSEYVDRADLVELLDKEYKFERRGVIIYEYYIHVSLFISKSYWVHEIGLNTSRHKTATIKSKLLEQSRK